MKKEVTFNGEVRAVESATVAELLQEFHLENKKVAVELNREIVQRGTYAETQINAGDQIEVVHFVGGG